MSLATRCTACGTVFRIVEDQLRVSDGWVRCGRCSEIFDARELLFDMEQDAPPPWPPAFAPVQAPSALPPPSPSPAAEEPAVAAVEPPPAAPPVARRPVPPPADRAPPSDPEPRIDPMPAHWPDDETRQEPRWIDEPTLPEPTPRPAPAPVPASSLPPAPAATVAPPAAMSGPPAAGPTPAAVSRTVVPEFMRRAERAARWNHPVARLALGTLSLLLAALLALQMTLHFRDALAALHPPWRDGLQALCEPFACEVKPWRRIDVLGIESSSLNPVGSGYRLQLALRNKAGVDVAAPWVELSLTDANGVPFARRVLPPDQFAPALQALKADSDQTLTLNFGTQGQRISGYSVRILHP